jgi:hypothetical protein
LQPFVGFTELQRLGAVPADWRVRRRTASFFAAGQLARFTGVFGAVAHAAFIYVLNALSFYYCACHLRWRPEGRRLARSSLHSATSTSVVSPLISARPSPCPPLEAALRPCG